MPSGRLTSTSSRTGCGWHGRADAETRHGGDRGTDDAKGDFLNPQHHQVEDVAGCGNASEADDRRRVAEERHQVTRGERRDGVAVSGTPAHSKKAGLDPVVNEPMREKLVDARSRKVVHHRIQGACIPPSVWIPGPWLGLRRGLFDEFKCIDAAGHAFVGPVWHHTPRGDDLEVVTFHFEGA